MYTIVRVNINLIQLFVFTMSLYMITITLQTLDVIGKTAFGYDFNSLENPQDPVSQAFQGVLEGKTLT